VEETVEESGRGDKLIKTFTSLRTLIAVFVVLLLFLVFKLAPPAAVVSIVLTTGLFALPGIPVGMALFGRRIWQNPETLIYGTIIGFALSGFAALGVAYFGGWVEWRIALAILAATAITLVLSRRFWDAPILPGLRIWEPADYTMLLSMWLIVTAFVAVPFMSFGRLTKLGFAYSWLFNYDFLLRMSFVSSITLGLPPDYLELTGNPLRLYLLSYTLPAFAYTHVHKAVPVESILMLFCLAISLLFVAALYAFLHLQLANRRALNWTMAASLCAYSYYWLFPAGKRILGALLGHTALGPKIAALNQFGDVSHLFRRFFLVEPQGVAGLCVFLLALFLLEAKRYKVESYAFAIILGLILGLEFGIEAWNGMLLVGWIGFVEAGRWLWGPRPDRRELGPLVTSAVICIACYFSFFLVGVYAFSSGKMMVIAPYWQALMAAPLYLPLEYGPILILGIWGLWISRRQQGTRNNLPLFLLFLFTLLQMFLLTAHGEMAKTLGVLKGNRILPIVLVLWTGYFLEYVFSGGDRRALRILALVLLLFAVPTIFTDVYFTSAINDPGRTSYVRAADHAACEWIRKNTPVSAVLQGEPEYIGYTGEPKNPFNTLSLMAAFGERHQVLGAYRTVTAVVNAEVIAGVRQSDLRAMFHASDTAHVLPVVLRYKIDYLYVGPYEQQLYPQFLQVLKRSPQEFEEVYDNDSVHIFRCIVSGTAKHETPELLNGGYAR
jgi:hypothetical protein